MIRLIRGGVYYTEGKIVKESVAFMVEKKKKAAIEGTITRGILKKHNRGGDETLRLNFDRLVSCGNASDIIRVAAESGIKKFSVPYTFSSEEEDVYCMSAANKFGGDYVLSPLAGIHCIVRSQVKCGDAVLCSDGTTRYGAYGALTFVANNGEFVKQLLGKTYNVKRPPVYAVYIKGKLKKGVGGRDVALSLIASATKKNFFNGVILEFIGSGIKNLPLELRNEIDMLVESTGCAATVWETDEAVENFYKNSEREEAFRRMQPADPAYYDGAAVIDLSKIEPMIVAKNGEIYALSEYLITKNPVYIGTDNPKEETALRTENLQPLPECTQLPQNIVLKITENAQGFVDEENVFGAIAAKSIESDDVIAQRRCGILANVATEYISDRYRSELVNWGILPLVCRKFDFAAGDYIHIDNIFELVESGCTAIPAKHISGKRSKNIMLELALSEEERQIILSGSLINYNKK